MGDARDALFDAFKPWKQRPTPEQADALIDARDAEVLREAAIKLNDVALQFFGDDCGGCGECAFCVWRLAAAEVQKLAEAAERGERR